jgi:metallo-beta-lactamase family protein
MEVCFIGPIGKVTGSCTWMRDTQRGWSFLVDCGMQQGEMTATEWNQCNWPFKPSEIKFVILTHAHIDHSGLIPALYRDGFKGTVYCTRETAELAKLSLTDAAKFPDAPFKEKDVERIKWHEPQRKPLLGNFHPIDHDLFVRFFRVGHVVGAVSASIYWGSKGEGQKSITFSGDIGPYFEDEENLPLLRFNMNPAPSNFAVIESTYGRRVRPVEETDAEHRRANLRLLIDQAIERQGALVMPAFALGRTQNLLFDLSWIYLEDPEKYRAVTILIDSPSAMKMHDIVCEALSRTECTGGHAGGKVRPMWLGKQLFRMLGLDDKDPLHHQRANEIIAMTLGMKATGDSEHKDLGNDMAKRWRPLCKVVSRADREQLIAEALGKPTVAVVSSGMCDGGPALAWLPRVLESARCQVALTGYCASGSAGGRLRSLENIPTSELVRHSGSIEWGGNKERKTLIGDIRASISVLSGYSEHSDQAGLLKWLFRQREDKWTQAGEVVFIQHGDDLSREALARAIETRASEIGLDARPVIPSDPKTWFDLDSDGEEVVQEQKRHELQKLLERVQRELATL